MTRRVAGAPEDARGAFLADFGRTERAAPGLRLFADRLEVSAPDGRRRRRVLPLARIHRTNVVDDEGSVVLRIDGPRLRLDLPMASAWEAALASELISGLREISDVQDRAATGRSAERRPRRARATPRRPAARRTRSRSAPSLILALEGEG